MKRYFVLLHVRIDGANVDVTLSQVCLLRHACYHLLFDFDHLLEVANSDIFFGLLLVVNAKVIVGHGQAAASVNIKTQGA